MIGNETHVAGEKRLISFVDARRHVRPPEKCLHVGGSIVEPHLYLKAGFARMQADPMHPFHPEHRIVITAPHDDRSVGTTLDVNFNRHEGGGTMMLRPVEFHSSGNPGAG